MMMLDYANLLVEYVIMSMPILSHKDNYSILIPSSYEFIDDDGICIYTILCATTRELDTDKMYNDSNGDMYTMFLCSLVRKLTIYYSPYHNIYNGNLFKRSYSNE